MVAVDALSCCDWLGHHVVSLSIRSDDRDGTRDPFLGTGMSAGTPDLSRLDAAAAVTNRWSPVRVGGVLELVPPTSNITSRPTVGRPTFVVLRGEGVRAPTIGHPSHRRLRTCDPLPAESCRSGSGSSRCARSSSPGRFRQIGQRPDLTTSGIVRFVMFLDYAHHVITGRVRDPVDLLDCAPVHLGRVQVLDVPRDLDIVTTSCSRHRPWTTDICGWSDDPTKSGWWKIP
jgi:hypothetical protein